MQTPRRTEGCLIDLWDNRRRTAHLCALESLGLLSLLSSPIHHTLHNTYPQQQVLTLEWAEGARLVNREQIRQYDADPAKLVDTLVQCSLRQMLEVRACGMCGCCLGRDGRTGGALIALGSVRSDRLTITPMYMHTNTERLLPRGPARRQPPLHGTFPFLHTCTHAHSSADRSFSFPFHVAHSVPPFAYPLLPATPLFPFHVTHSLPPRIHPSSL